MDDMKKHKLNSGFTIIEVVLVLAIAGLIFLMVFLALPALQRSQRDTQRKQTLSKIAAILEESRANNKGNYVSDYSSNRQLENFVQNYLAPHRDEFLDPSTGEFYTFLKCGSKVDCGTGIGQDEVQIGEIYYNSNAECENNRFVDKPANANNFILLTRFESSGLYCFSSSN